MTLLLTAVLCDVGAAVIFFSTEGCVWVLMRPLAAEQGAPEAIAFIGVWECILLASNMLEAALAVSSWRFYKAFREAGLYPPRTEGERITKEVAMLELVCEAEDVALLSEHCSTCSSAAQHNVENQQVVPQPASV
eukprot:CAMPEP_0198583028 /NCGR_PEP_ID=MMETSP1462-20131121/126243_1 /TAXON_ID=1333877 /ORGANISM="Brandtodinium nutriculum, Strain RCC3387" /LENGTH=134 /DNA_ID=CAMNT_0044314439 /DNA_START=1 /DNA_END=402 /DNA_ORIENTATION=+